jgi:hypothetical protein
LGSESRERAATFEPFLDVMFEPTPRFDDDHSDRTFDCTL